MNEAAKLKLWSGAGRNANKLRCGEVKNVEGALSVTQTILNDCKKQCGRVLQPHNMIFKKHPMASKRNLDFTIKCDKLGPSLLPRRKHWNNISGTHFAKNKNYRDNNREETVNHDRGRALTLQSSSDRECSVLNTWASRLGLQSPPPDALVGNNDTVRIISCQVYHTDVKTFIKPWPEHFFLNNFTNNKLKVNISFVFLYQMQK